MSGADPVPPERSACNRWFWSMWISEPGWYERTSPSISSVISGGRSSGSRNSAKASAFPGASPVEVSRTRARVISRSLIFPMTPLRRLSSFDVVVAVVGGVVVAVVG
eukprot:6177699-Pyramimonas_sp.AAC.1